MATTTATKPSDRDVLPDHVKPTHYQISLHDLELGGAFGYKGAVNIEIAIVKPTSTITLNSHELKISGSEVVINNNGSVDAIGSMATTYEEKAQRAVLHYPHELPVTAKATLRLVFTGTMNNAMGGFYRSKYKPVVEPASSVAKDGEYHCMFSTQFESCEARRAFPCFDEPNLKATFDFDIEIPDDQVALSNQPVKAEKKGGSGLKTVSFERTPVMSTYLLAWAFGDFEYVEDFTARKYDGKNLPVRVYTTRGLKEQGRFALKNAHQIIDYYSDIFGIDYPLPKADLLAVHEFTHGAMENWGLVTYRTTAVLFDEANSDSSYKTRVAYVVAHELAHQWFGNLVTMDWWSELWLNEGFATWVGWLAIDHLYPEWNVWARFVTECVQTAFQLDSLRGSHPIEVPVKDALDIDQIFDHISYLKGSSVLRMLCGHLGTQVFLKGVSQYLKEHAYSNATTSDLWAALSKASGEDVNRYMDDWIRKIGFPVLTVAEEPGQIGLRQTRFLSTGDVKPEEDQTKWWIPLGLNAKSKTAEALPRSIGAKEETIRHIDESFYKVNANTGGFYRTNYPPERLTKLGAARDKLSLEDKIGLIGDAAALAASGDGTTAGLLALVQEFGDESNHLVWSQIFSSLAHVRSVFSDNEKIVEGVKSLTRKLGAPLLSKLGWEYSDSEDFLTGQLRSLSVLTLAGSGHKETVDEAIRRFKLFSSGQDRKAVHPNLRLAIFRTAVSELGRPGYDALTKEYLSTTLTDGKEITLQALGRAQDPQIIAEYLDFLYSDKVAAQDIHSGTRSLGANAKARLSLWDYTKSHWNDLRTKLAGNSIVLDRYLKVSFPHFASHDVNNDMAAFFNDKDNKGYDRTLGVLADTIRGNANYRERDEKLVLEWLQAHKYV